MRFIIYLALTVIILIGANAAPKNNKKIKNKNNKFNKTCNQCRIKGQDTLSPICGRIGDIENTFDSRAVFECFIKCRKVQDFEFLYNERCRQTREQCKTECDQNIFLKAPPGCEGHPSGLKGMTTYPYEALLDCYIKCPDNNLNKLHQGPCINERNHPVYAKYGALAPYHVCFNSNTSSCQTRKLKAFEQYPVPPV